MNKNFGKIGFIGGGKMAQAIIKGIIRSNFFSTNDIYVAEPNLKIADYISTEFGIKVISTNKELAKHSNIIVFAVKPFVVEDVINDIKSVISSDKMIISILAGISTDYIQSELGISVPVIRVMPNTPALVNEGMSAVCKGSKATNSHLNFATKYNLPFVLLSDTELSAIQAYGVWQEKKLYGKVSMGVVRTTFLIDEQGVIQAVMPKVKPDTNADEILALLEDWN